LAFPIWTMTTEDLKNLINIIVAQARRLTATRTNEGGAPVNYACVFAQSEDEYSELVDAAHRLGTVTQETAMGPVFKIEPLETAAGRLELLKIRKPDPIRKERGDADFTVSDYEKFKQTYLGRPGFRLIARPELEMMELADPAYDVLAYFSYPTLVEVLKIN